MTSTGYFIPEMVIQKSGGSFGDCGSTTICFMFILLSTFDKWRLNAQMRARSSGLLFELVKVFINRSFGDYIFTKGFNTHVLIS